MKSSFLRRDFLKSGSMLVAGAAIGGFNIAGASEKVRCSTPSAAKLGWIVGSSQYTFRRFSLFEALGMIADLGIQCVEPAFFLSLDKARPKLKVNQDLTPEVRKELKQRLADRGMAMPTFYSNLGAKMDEARKIFDFCKEMGVGVIVAEPPAETFDAIEKLCDEYRINLAVHNHPKKPDYKYWDPANVLAMCKGRSKRIGACCDTGHWVRSGLDCVECLKILEGRILGFHLKDVAEKGKPEARDVPLGKGKADYTAVLKELKRQGYRGNMGIEYEHDSPQLSDDVAQCAAFVEKTAKALGG